MKKKVIKKQETVVMKRRLYPAHLFRKFYLLASSFILWFILVIYIFDFKKSTNVKLKPISKEKSILYSILIIKNDIFHQLDWKWEKSTKRRNIL